MSQQIVLSIPGMKCGGCVANVEKALNAESGVSGVNVDLDSKTARLQSELPVARLVEVIKAAGYDAEPIDG